VSDSSTTCLEPDTDYYVTESGEPVAFVLPKPARGLPPRKLFTADDVTCLYSTTNTDMTVTCNSHLNMAGPTDQLSAGAITVIDVIAHTIPHATQVVNASSSYLVLDIANLLTVKTAGKYICFIVLGCPTGQLFDKTSKTCKVYH
jgi:hypothetical protein